MPLIIITFIFMLNYYVEAICVTRLDQSRTSRFGSMATFLSALVLSFVWNHPFVSQLTNVTDQQHVASLDHVFSGGVAFSFVLFMFGKFKDDIIFAIDCDCFVLWSSYFLLILW